jgi:3-carboxy-cis,cis-muconate cycloisomerase
VALAEYAAAQLPAMHRAQLHENERSGTAWTLEWMVLPPILVAGLAGLRRADQLLGTIAFQAAGTTDG